MRNIKKEEERAAASRSAQKGRAAFPLDAYTRLKLVYRDETQSQRLRNEA